MNPAPTSEDGTEYLQPFADWLQHHDASIAAKAREDVLDEQRKNVVFEITIDKLKFSKYMCVIDLELTKFMLAGSCNGVLVLYDKSLRSKGGEQ